MTQHADRSMLLLGHESGATLKPMAPTLQQQPVQAQLAPLKPVIGTPAQQLKANLYNAAVAEFGQDAVEDGLTYPAVYFDHSVTTIAPNGTTTPRQPGLCATAAGLSAVSQIFAPGNFEAQGIVALGFVQANAVDPILVEENPAVQNPGALPGGFADNKAVPYIQFGSLNDPNFKPGLVNVGILLQIFSHYDYPTSTLMWAAISEIQGN
jgi:hypothetical protein